MSIIDYIMALLGRQKRVSEQILDLCLPLRYVIGIDDPVGRDGEITMCSFYTRRRPRKGVVFYYLNLYVEEGELTEYGPYRKRTSTANKYEEGVPMFGTPGFWANIERQVQKILALGGLFVETDNRDAYLNSQVLEVFDYLRKRGLRVVLKNPGVSDYDQDSIELFRHSSVVGAIVERGDVMPRHVMEMMRKADVILPAWFVSFNDDEGGLEWAERCRDEIITRQLPCFGVTYSASRKEYAESGDIWKPKKEF